MASEVVLHTKFKYKPENNDKYVTLYFQSSTNDVIISTNLEGFGDQDQTTLTDVLTSFVDAINNRALKPIYDFAKSLYIKDPILKKGQFGIESDTLQFKIGDGTTPWRYLPYAITNEINGEYAQIITNNASKITSLDGTTDISVLQLNNLKAADSAPSGAKAYVQIIGPSEDSDVVEETP